MEPNIETHNNMEQIWLSYHKNEMGISPNSTKKLAYKVKIAQYQTHLSTNIEHLP